MNKIIKFLEIIMHNRQWSIWISLIALGISGYTLWATRLAPFKLDVLSTKRVGLTCNPNDPRQPGIIIQLLFSNKGARRGYVDDVALKLVKVDSKTKPILFRSIFEVKDDELNFTSQLPSPKMTTFNSFLIDREIIAKKIIFIPQEGQEVINFEKATYSVTPYIQTIGKKWKAFDAMKVEVTEGDLQALKLAEMTPDEKGGYFLKWVQQDKPTIERELSLSRLKSKIENE